MAAAGLMVALLAGPAPRAAAASRGAPVSLRITAPAPDSTVSTDPNVTVAVVGGAASTTVRFVVTVDGIGVGPDGELLTSQGQVPGVHAIGPGEAVTVGLRDLPPGSHRIEAVAVGSPVGAAPADVEVTVAGRSTTSGFSPLFILALGVLVLAFFLMRRRMRRLEDRYGAGGRADGPGGPANDGMGF